MHVSHLNYLYTRGTKLCVFGQFINELQAFHKKNGFPKIVGLIDGTHVRIMPLPEFEDEYINRKIFILLL